MHAESYFSVDMDMIDGKFSAQAQLQGSLQHSLKLSQSCAQVRCRHCGRMISVRSSLAMVMFIAIRTFRHAWTKSRC